MGVTGLVINKFSPIIQKMNWPYTGEHSRAPTRIFDVALLLRCQGTRRRSISHTNLYEGIVQKNDVHHSNATTLKSVASTGILTNYMHFIISEPICKIGLLRKPAHPFFKKFVIEVPLHTSFAVEVLIPSTMAQCSGVFGA